jgi:serine/threonine protein kinase
MLTPGQTVERYTVEAVVGHGGMAVVYRVRHNQLGSLHALKILTVPKPHIRERLLVEGRAQAAIRHPNVVAVFDVVEVGNAPALLMEYVDGPTLEVWLENEAPSLEEAEKLFVGICAGVGEAHAHGLVHRDLKPANVLLAPTTGGWIPKVTDFGIAKIIAGDSPDGGTRTNVAMGTPHYMAPEQIRDAKTVDQRADIFSLGCILYELVCGEKPFNGPDVLTVLNSVATGRYASPRKHVPELPDRFLRAIEGALRVDRDNRLQDCAQLVAVLAGGQPSAASTWPSMRKESTAPDATPVPPPAASATAESLQRPPAVVTEPSMAIDDFAAVDPALLDKNTPSTPIDPNASTVPHIVRREAPRTNVDRTRAQGFRVAMAGSLLMLVVAAALWWNVEPQPTVRRVPGGPDEAVMGVTRELPVPVTDDGAADAEPAIEAGSVTASARPSVRSSPKTATTSASPVSTKGLGLFESPPAARPADGKGRVEVLGDVRSALVAPGSKEKVPPGDVAPGTYDVLVTFPGRDPKVQLQVSVTAGEVVRVDCAPTRTCAVVAP